MLLDEPGAELATDELRMLQQADDKRWLLCTPSKRSPVRPAAIVAEPLHGLRRGR